MVAADAFPPGLIVGSDADVGEDGVAIERAHHVGIGLAAGAGSDTEEAGFGIDGVEIAVGAEVHPGDVVADGPNLVALRFERGNHHGKIGFAASAGECGCHVGDLSTGRFEPEDEHVFGHPTLLLGHVTGDAQGETFFAKQRVAAVAGADAPDEALFGEVRDVTTKRIEIPERMKAGDKVGGIAETICGHPPDAGHDAHAGNDVGAVGDFDADWFPLHCLFIFKRQYLAFDV